MSPLSRSVRDALARAGRPLVRALIRGRVTPGALATVGFLAACGAAVAFAAGRVRLGGLLLFFAASVALLGGEVQRQEGASTAFAVFYASTLDRMGEAAVLAGVALFFLQGGVPPSRVTVAVGLTLAAMAASYLASYTRARAEALGVECAVGIVRRSERLLAFGAAALALGAGREGRLLVWIVALVTLATAITVTQRLVHAARTTHGPAVRVSRPRATLPGHSAARRKGH